MAVVSDAVSEHPQGVELLRRAPSGYIWNQLFNFWTFGTLFLHQIIITHVLSTSERGVFELVKTPAALAVALAALGLDSAGSVFLPRALAEGGRLHAASVATRLAVIRLITVLAFATIILFALPLLGSLLAAPHIDWLNGIAQGLSSPEVDKHRLAVAGYTVAVGLTNLLAALLTALLRTRIIFIVGGLAQLATVGLAWLLVAPLGGGADGALWALTIPSAFTAAIYAFVLIRLLGLRTIPLPHGKTLSMMGLGAGAWLADLANGSLLKSLAILQLSIGVAVAIPHFFGYADANTPLAFFGIAFEMGHAATFLFINGISGVGLAVLAATYANKHKPHLATAWRTICKLQVALGIPLLAFCVPNSYGIIVRLYGERYAPAGFLLGLFLALNGLTRLAGGGAHEAAIYVLGKAQWAVIGWWAALGALFIGDVLLIPRFGVAGCLLAVGLAQMVAQIIQLGVARYYIGSHFPVAYMVKVVLALVPGMLLSLVWRPTSWAGLGAAGLTFAALFIGALLIIRPLDSEDAMLLAQTAPTLRRLLMPFVGRDVAAPSAEGSPVPAGATTPRLIRLAAAPDDMRLAALFHDALAARQVAVDGPYTLDAMHRGMIPAIEVVLFSHRAGPHAYDDVAWIPADRLVPVRVGEGDVPAALASYPVVDALGMGFDHAANALALLAGGADPRDEMSVAVGPHS
ncbi:MAG TPA: hypothetical protein VF807_04010 [Ktedonobacterales bacterium]